MNNEELNLKKLKYKKFFKQYAHIVGIQNS